MERQKRLDNKKGAMSQAPRIAIFGSGFVAQAYMRALHYLGFHPEILSRSWLDYTKRDVVRLFLSSQGFNFIINASGYTGRTVDDCEENPMLSIEANHIVPVMLAEEARRVSAGFIHISTGCMFTAPGRNYHPFTEEDKPNFLCNVYQADKRDAEVHISNVLRDRPYWIFRIRMPFSQFPHPRNWLTKLGNYHRIIDGLNSATWIDEFAIRSWQLVNKAPSGIYHAVQPGPVWTIDVARRVHECQYPFIPDALSAFTDGELEVFHRGHVRRSEAVLDCSKFEETYRARGTPTMNAIRYCIANMGKGWGFDPNAGQLLPDHIQSISEDTPQSTTPAAASGTSGAASGR